MQYTLVLAALASLAVAQTSTSAAAAAGGTCAAETTLNVCIASIQGQINSCAQNDYSCLCTQYVNLLTCYSNCPNDPGVGTAQQQRELNCNNASVYGSTTTYGTKPATAATASATDTSGGSTAVETGFGSATGSGSSSSSTGSSSGNGAASLEIASGLVAVAAAGFGLVL